MLKVICMQTKQHALFSHTYVQLANICFAAFNFCALGLMLALYIYNLYLVQRAKLAW